MVISTLGLAESGGFMLCAALATATSASCQPSAYASRDAAFTILLISSTGSVIEPANQMSSEPQFDMVFLTHVKNYEAFHQFICHLDDITGKNKVVHRRKTFGLL